MTQIEKIYRRYRSFTPFTDAEAWMLFKLAAFSEAVGWTLLIGGILSKRFLFHGNDLPVQLTGRLHGTFFMLYIAAVLIFSPSLGWSWARTCIAGLCSVPPYGSLMFEQWEQIRRNRSSLRQFRQLLYYRGLVSS